MTELKGEEVSIDRWLVYSVTQKHTGVELRTKF
jgi:hypothetical protein